ncbi:hypothetical protein ACS0TY_005783 [Phlomoides rotata]
MSEIMASMPLPWVSSSKTERTSLLSAEATRPPTSVALVWKLHPTEYSREGAKLFNFRDDTLTLLLELRIKASSGSSDIKIGVGIRNISGGGVYICLRNLDPVIDDNVLEFSTGARMLTPYYNIRYELYPFYNETRLRELHLLQPLPPSLPPSSTTCTF